MNKNKKEPLIDIDDEQMPMVNSGEDIGLGHEDHDLVMDFQKDDLPKEQQETADLDNSHESIIPREIMEKIDHLEQIVKEKEELFLRAKADQDNIRKRSDAEILSAKKYGASALAKELFAIIDNFERALDAVSQEVIEEGTSFYSLKTGLDMTMKMIKEMLERNNITIAAKVGDPFNPNFHQAIQEIENADIQTNHIAQVLQQGYILHDRLLRPAMVIVAKNS